MAIITGTIGDDTGAKTLNGTNLADEIYGLGGNDTLIGYEGDDVLEGGPGADQLFGSPGFDYASYRSSPESVVVHLLGQISYADAEGDHLYSIEGLIGSAFPDNLEGDDQRNVLRGEGGNDGLAGYDGDDVLIGSGGSDGLEGGAGADELRGGSGTDFAYYDNSAQGVLVDLAAGTGRFGDAEGDRLFSIEGVNGSELGDTLIGNAAANRFWGNTSRDVMTGGSGADRFLYYFKSDSTPTAPDAILDFSHAQGDRIDLREIDANEQVDGGQAFQFIGNHAFTGPGQLHWYQSNGDTIVEANTTDLTAGAEMKIVIDPLFTPQATDFVL